MPFLLIVTVVHLGCRIVPVPLIFGKLRCVSTHSPFQESKLFQSCPTQPELLQYSRPSGGYDDHYAVNSVTTETYLKHVRRVIFFLIFNDIMLRLFSTVPIVHTCNI